ncbi:MAG: peptidoglycan-binding protein [Deltaproteobacteria bacterium]|nr:MAG: peptidoglycan-binding protein [Deltaproteobacteria bacterium]
MATAPPTAPSPPPQIASAPPSAAPEPPGPAEVEQRLAALDARASAREALNAVFAAWGVRLLAPREPADARAFTGAAVRRGLEHLLVSSNGTLLRALDLPAILELNPPDAAGLRYAAVVNLSTTGATLVIGDATGAVDRAFLDRAWFGRAHVFWRDFDGIGALTGASSGGVRRLQTLLRRAGIYHGPETGVFDEATRVAVLEFQRARFLVADGLPGPLTRILLYDVAGGYTRPTLGAGGGGTS